MTDPRALDPLLRHLRAHVAELRRLEAGGAAPSELAEHKWLIVRLQDRLADAVRDLVTVRSAYPSARWPETTGVEISSR